MHYKQNLLFNFIVATLIIFITFSCEKDTFELENISENEDFIYHSQDSLNVSQDLAITAALNFGNFSKLINSDSKLRRNKIKIENVIIVPDKQGEPAIYVINYVNAGYIILSATLKESPVLAFSDTEYFDIENVPLGMANWFYGRMHKIEVIKNKPNYQIPETVSVEWSDVLENSLVNPSFTGKSSGGGTVGQYGPLLTTEWGQAYPYNKLLPKMICGDNSNVRPPTGCIPTAIAQVARYHAYGLDYDWSIMPKSKWSGRNTAGDNEVAKLMRDIGRWTNTDYHCTGSPAKEGYSVSVFKRLGYSNPGNRHTLVRENVAGFIKTEMMHKRPVIMSGCSEAETYTSGWWIFKIAQTKYDGCHYWVCDGYSFDHRTVVTNFFGTIITKHYSTDFYHMNWGWDGTGMSSSSNNGWFRIDDSDPEWHSIDYKYDIKYVSGIKP